MRSKSLDERALDGKIGSQQKSRQKVMRGPKIVPSKFKRGVKQKRDQSHIKESQSHLEDTSDQLQAPSFQALLHAQFLSLQPKRSRHHI